MSLPHRLNSQGLQNFSLDIHFLGNFSLGVENNGLFPFFLFLSTKDSKMKSFQLHPFRLLYK